jgi:hypothetical protein
LVLFWTVGGVTAVADDVKELKTDTERVRERRRNHTWAWVHARQSVFPCLFLLHRISAIPRTLQTLLLKWSIK